MEYHQLSIVHLIKQLQTSANLGLSEEAAQKRLTQFGLNVLPSAPAKSWIRVFLSQFESPLIYILLIAASIIYFVGPDKKDAFIISAVLLFNAIIGTIQEGRTRNILESLKRFISTQCFVLRSGTKKLINDGCLVPGDVILLQEGQRVPADARLIESNSMQIDEAILTGESEPVRKIVDIIEDETPLADR